MKKRILSLITAIFLIVPFFTLSVSATSVPYIQTPPIFNLEDAILSSDYQTLTLKDATYVRFNASMTCWDTISYYDDNSCDYLDNVSSISYEISKNNCFITASIYYNDGSCFTCHFINENLLNEHNKLENEKKTYTVEFSHDKRINLSATDLSATSTQINISDIDFYYGYDVNVYSTENDYYIEKGYLSLIDEKYYYFDYKLNNVDGIYYSGEQTTILTAYEVTNADLISEFNEITGNGNLDIIDLIISGKLFSGIGTVLLCIIFALLPIIIFVIFFILSIKTKTPIYKRLFTAIYITSVFELVVFIASVILLIVFR